MAMVINSNISSLNAQRNLNQSQGMLDTAMKRLSSGLRINSAKDDAAGLAISDRMTAQVRGMNQAIRNANDGISLTQTAEGSMQETTNLLQRMRELAVQASNETNSASDRKAIQSEVSQLFEEIDRIAGTSSFNGTKLLDGSFGSKKLQVGSNSGESMSLKLNAVDTKSLNLNGYSGLGELNGGRTGALTGAETMTINGVSVTSGTSVQTTVDAINAATGQTGVTASGYNVVKGVAGASGKIASGDLTVQVGAAAAVTINASNSLEEIAENINKQVGGVNASISDGALVISNDTGETITIGGTAAGNAGLTLGASNGYISLSSLDGSQISLGGANVNAFGFNTSTGSTTVTGSAVTGQLLAADDVTINGVQIDGAADASASAAAAAINAKLSETGVRASASTTVTGTSGTGATGVVAGGELLINGVDIAAVYGAATADMADLVTAINTSGVQGVRASMDSAGALVLTSDTGLDIEVAVTGTTTGLSSGTTQGTLTLTSETGADVKVGGTAADLAKIGLVEQGGSDEAVGSGLDVTTVANANKAIERIDAAISFVAEQRGNIGALQNRLSSTISNLSNSVENLSTARSRIQDADFASETTSLSKAQILQQAGTAMLAQANQASQGVLSLLR